MLDILLKYDKSVNDEANYNVQENYLHSVQCWFSLPYLRDRQLLRLLETASEVKRIYVFYVIKGCLFDCYPLFLHFMHAFIYVALISVHLMNKK